MNMKTYISDCRTRQIWYDHHLRLWTMQTLDTKGHQIGNVDYGTCKYGAFCWMHTGHQIPRYPYPNRGLNSRVP